MVVCIGVLVGALIRLNDGKVSWHLYMSLTLYMSLLTLYTSLTHPSHIPHTNPLHASHIIISLTHLTLP